MCKIFQMLKYLFAQNSPEFQIARDYQTNQCAYTNVIDANLLQIALKLPTGWMRHKVIIKDLGITNLNLDPKFDYVSYVDQLLKYKDLTVTIHQIANKHGVLDGTIHVKNPDNKFVNIRDLLYDHYIKHLIQGIPVDLEVMDTGIIGLKKRNKIKRNKDKDRPRPKAKAKLKKLLHPINLKVDDGMGVGLDSEPEPEPELKLAPDAFDKYAKNTVIDIESDWSVTSSIDVDADWEELDKLP